MVRIIADAQTDLATKRDLSDLESRLINRMETMEYRMTIKLGGLIVAAVGIVATLVKLL